jgi:hypothetical protein
MRMASAACSAERGDGPAQAQIVQPAETADDRLRRSAALMVPGGL